MRKLNAMTVGFIAIILTITIDSFVLLTAIDNLTDAVRESNKANEQVVIVTREIQEDGDVIFEYGDVSDEYYFYTITNKEQGIYEYYFPAMHIDWPIECDSLEELQDVISCHIEQAYPNARFVMRNN